MVHSGQFVTPLLCSRQDKTKKGSFTVCYSEILKNSLLYFIKNKLGEIKKTVSATCLPYCYNYAKNQSDCSGRGTCWLQWCWEPVLSSWCQRSVGYNGARNLPCRPGVKDPSVTVVSGTCLVVLVSKIRRLQWRQEPVVAFWCQRSVGYNGARNLSCRPGFKDLSVTMMPGTCLVVLVSKICQLQWCQEPVLLSWCQKSVGYNGARNLSGCPGGSQISALLRPREPVRILILKYFQKLQKGAGTVYTVHSQEIQT